MMKQGFRKNIHVSCVDVDGSVQQELEHSFPPGRRGLGPPTANRQPRTCGASRIRGQAYTEYLVILLFGVFMCLGVVVIDTQLPEGQVRIMDRLYGYIFDYYAGLANFINLPIF